jgi:predicted anti-sigma-YlaC factor YlaD
MDCEGLRDVAAELAAGTLPGDERADALEHLSDCPACRDEVAELAELVDRLLLVAPPAEPPVGFESRVLASISGHRRWVRRPPWASLAALVAALALVVGLAAGAAWGRRDSARPPVVAALLARDGRDVGHAVLASGRPGWVVVDVAGLGWSGAPAESYMIELDLGQGRLVRAGTVRVVDGRGTAQVKARAGVVGVHLVSAAGDYECKATFT